MAPVELAKMFVSGLISRTQIFEGHNHRISIRISCLLGVIGSYCHKRCHYANKFPKIKAKVSKGVARLMNTKEVVAQNPRKLWSTKSEFAIPTFRMNQMIGLFDIRYVLHLDDVVIM
jgi:hypothetical protein